MFLETRLKTMMLSLSLDVGDELLCLVGPSGSGKSTILRSIAGVYQPDNGSIEIRGRQVFSAGLNIGLPPAERHVGFVPQSHALFGHLSVGENIAYPLLKQTSLSPAIVANRVERLSELLDLADELERLPADLPPVTQLRVALGRALVTDPELLLLDDPFVGLDHESRKSARRFFSELLRRVRVPTIFATVELEEAYEMADRIALIDGGRLLQVDSPRSVMLRPAGRRVAELVRSVNVFEGTVVAIDDGAATIEITVGIVRMLLSASVGEKVDIVIRPEHVELIDGEPNSGDNVLTGTIVELLPHGEVSALTIRPSGARGGATVEAFVSNSVVEVSGLAVGRSCRISLPARALHAMPTPPGI